MSNKNHLVENGFYNTSFSGTDMVAIMQIDGTKTMNGTHVLGSLQTLSYSLHMERRPIRSIGNVNAKDYVMGPRTIAGSLVFAVFDRHFAYSLMNDIRTETKNYTFLADELPPFNITITFANEYGKRSKLTIYGVRLINEGQVMSINDIFTENTYQYVATDIDYMTNLEGDDGTDQLFPQRDFPKHVEPPDGNGYDDIILEEDKPYDEESKEDEDSYKLNCDLDYYRKPTDNGLAYQNRAAFTVEPKPTRGGICIKTSGSDILIPTSAQATYPLYQDLDPGEYKAYYYNDNKIKSNTVEFTISKIDESLIEKVETPLVIRLDYNSFTVKLEKGQHGIRYREVTMPLATWQTEALGPVVDRTITINNLKPGTFYEILAYKNMFDSESIRIKTTLTSVNNIFKRMVNDNMNDMLAFDGSEETVKNFMFAADKYQSLNPNSSITESYMNAVVQETKINMTHPEVRYYLAHQASLLESLVLKNYQTVEPVSLKDTYSAELVMPDQTATLIIEGNNSPKQVIPKNKLIRSLDEDHKPIRSYLLNDRAGAYSTYRINDENRHSCYLQVPVIDVKDKASEQIRFKNLIERKKSKQKNAMFDMTLIEHGLEEKELEILSNQWSMQKNNFAEMLLHPEIEQQSKKVIITLSGSKRSVNHLLWLCISETDRLLDENLVTKIETTSSNNYQAELDMYDYFIEPNKRYTVWYQDPKTSIRYMANSFVYGNSEVDIDEIDTCLFNLEFNLIKKYIAIAVNKYACYHLRSYLESRLQTCLESNFENIQEVLIDLMQLISAENNLTKEDTCFALLCVLEIERLIVGSHMDDNFIKVLFDADKKLFGCNTYGEKDIYVIKGFVYKGECHYLSPESVDYNWQTDVSYCPIGSIAFLQFFQYGSNRILSPITADISNNVQVFGQSINGGNL